MKLNAPVNENYAAVVVSIKSITPLENCDNVVGTPLLGFQAIISKDTKEGTLGIVFPAETQLSLEYAAANNLHRHSELNSDNSKVGYLEDNRRVKAMKFRNHRSDALFMPLTSLAYTGVNIDELKEGDVFDELNGNAICNKFLRKPKGVQRVEKNKVVKFVRIDNKFLPEHYDSDNYFRNQHVINENKMIIVTQKLHGTSIRIGNTIVKRELTVIDKLLQKLGIKIQNTHFDHVAGSRKAIKDINNPNQQHFYGTDIWTLEGKKLEGIVPENFILYGELVGWTPDKQPIQKGYTYGVPEGETELYIYRIAFVNNQGRIVDLSWDQTVELTKDLGLKTVPELWRGLKKDFVVEDFIDKRFTDAGYAQAVDLGAAKIVDEGVCVRVDGLAPYITKAKSPIFFQHETKMLDEEALDLEAEGSAA